MPRKKDTITLSVPPGTKEQLEAIADRLGIYWGSSPSASGLVTKIAQQELDVNVPFTLSPEQIAALRQAVKDLVDSGHAEEAKSVITLLLNYGNLEAPLRQELLRQISQPVENWRMRIDQYITDRQPFYVLYGNSQDDQLEFSAHYAQITFYEKRHYLQIWCDETDDSTDIPELHHNRCLRLDRIQALHPFSGEWRNSLDSISATFQLTGWLRKAYEPKPDDIDDQMTEQSRWITRKIANPFWFFREILRYGEEAEIIAPDMIRQQFAAKVRSLADRYQPD
ncbi:helix-turn-helix transcriptional regulator [Alkalinema pantanalense CENA528]|uniref:helix-turn-helix transcriptional regulator n=1 Tax=Alkalinema pantanalense TaxID=1620705 RepID=UPI003D700E1D